MKKELLTATCVEAFKEGYNRSKNPVTITASDLLFVDPNLGNNEQLNVHIVSKPTTSHFAVVRGLKFLTLSGFVTVPTITYSKKLDACPEYVIRFITSHEVGHIYNQDDPKTYKKRQLTRMFHLDPSEAAADLFAAKHVGKETALEALEYIKERLPFFASLEVGRRIKALERAIVQ